MVTELLRQKFLTGFYYPYKQTAVNENEGGSSILTITQHLLVPDPVLSVVVKIKG